MKNNISKEMLYCPVLIPTLCRYEHFTRCVESLKQNIWSRYTDVYIALDYPLRESHKNGYKKICKYLEEDFSEFASFNIIKRTRNLGSLKNLSELIEDILKKYDRFICLEDDLEVSQNFLEYINKCMMYFQNDTNVMAVTGYSYPVEWVISKECNLFKSNVIFPAWGTAYYRDRYREMQSKILSGYIKRSFKSITKVCNIEQMTIARYLDYINGALSYSSDNLTEIMTDISTGIYIQIENKNIIMPRVSKVRNYGFDGTGQYCQDIKIGATSKTINTAHNYNYSVQQIDNEDFFEIKLDKKFDNILNKEIMDCFDRRSFWQISKTKLKWHLYLICGEKRYKYLWRKLRKKQRI